MWNPAMKKVIIEFYNFYIMKPFNNYDFLYIKNEFQVNVNEEANNLFTSENMIKGYDRKKLGREIKKNN